MRNPDHAPQGGKVSILPTLCKGAMSALLLASSVSVVSAQTATGNVPAHVGSTMIPRMSQAETSAETIDQRVASLHDELKITTSEEADWKAVAQTMRDNADAMAKLASQKQSQSSAARTAVEDLQTYSMFAQAHVDHLKKLTSVFATLYTAMPAAQKKLADQVFARSHRDEQGAAQKPG